MQLSCAGSPIWFSFPLTCTHFLGDNNVLRFLKVMLLSGALSAVSVTFAWIMIARKGFVGVESSDSSVARFLRYFVKVSPQRYASEIRYGYRPQASNLPGFVFTSSMESLKWSTDNFLSGASNNSNSLGQSNSSGAENVFATQRA